MLYTTVFSKLFKDSGGKKEYKMIPHLRSHRGLVDTNNRQEAFSMWPSEEALSAWKYRLHSNENENTIHQSLYDGAQAVLRGTFIAMSDALSRTEKQELAKSK